jgi:hypothetical protein
VCRDSVVGKATRYGLDGPVIKSHWRRDFSHHPRPWAHPASCKMGTGSLPGLKRRRRGVEVKERVEVCLYYPSGPSWPVVGVNCTFTLYYIPRNSTENINYRNPAGNVKATCMIRHVSFSLNNSKEHGGDCGCM